MPPARHGNVQVRIVVIKQWQETIAFRKHGAAANEETDRQAYAISYFQFRDLPSAIHFTACAMRFALVSDRLAPAIHSAYSRRQLGLNPSNAFAAILFFFNAALSSARTRTLRFAAFGRRSIDFVRAPLSTNSAARRRYPATFDQAAGPSIR